jgi:hypothetical protein
MTSNYFASLDTIGIAFTFALLTGLIRETIIYDARNKDECRELVSQMTCSILDPNEDLSCEGFANYRQTLQIDYQLRDCRLYPAS